MIARDYSSLWYVLFFLIGAGNGHTKVSQLRSDLGFLYKKIESSLLMRICDEILVEATLVFSFWLQQMIILSYCSVID